jgi:hypothetical protein
MSLALLTFSLWLTAEPPVPASIKVSPEAASTAGWWPTASPSPFRPEWFAARYGVGPPVVEAQRYTGLRGRVDVHYVCPANAADLDRLWAGLSRDLAPNQALGRTRQVIVLVVSEDAEYREMPLAKLTPLERAAATGDLDWLPAEVPNDVPGLRHSYTRFLPDLPELERRAGGHGLRAVYQTSFEVAIPGVRTRRNLAQVDFWVPRDAASSPALATILAKDRQAGQSVLTGRGAVAVVTAWNEPGQKILLDLLAARGWASLVVATPGGDPTRPATPPKPPGR